MPRKGIGVRGAGADSAGLEHQPRDPFEAGTGAALEVLNATWGTRFRIWHDGMWHASRDGGAGLTLSCETPDELERAMRGYGGTW